MSKVQAGSKAEALRLLASDEVRILELDYETGWQDAVELGRIGEKCGIKVQYRGHESIAVASREALIDGLNQTKSTFRQRNLYCQFDLGSLANQELADLENKASRLGDFILAGHLIRDVDSVWPSEADVHLTTSQATS